MVSFKVVMSGNLHSSYRKDTPGGGFSITLAHTGAAFLRG
jgi:hypothetical protein